MDQDVRLITAEIPRLRRYARALLRDDDRADDLVQETLLRGLDKLHLYRSGTDLRAWLFTMMHNQYVNHVRRWVRQRETIAGKKVRHVSPVAQMVSIELQDVQRAIQHLSEEQRTTLLLIALEGMTYDEVAQICNIPIGTVRSRLSRARKELRQMTEARDIRPDVGSDVVMLHDHAEAGDENHFTDRLNGASSGPDRPSRRLGGASSGAPIRICDQAPQEP
jgi:RNA polymerase sigma-70 factor, ECF subfamily